MTKLDTFFIKNNKCKYKKSLKIMFPISNFLIFQSKLNKFFVPNFILIYNYRFTIQYLLEICVILKSILKSIYKTFIYK